MRLALIVAVIVSLAGCADEGPADEPGPASSPSPGAPPGSASPTPTSTPTTEPAANLTAGEEMPWEIRDCFFIYAQPRAITTAVQAMLPEGFTIGSTAGTTSVGFEANICGSGTGLHNETIRPAGYASVWVAAAPPEGWGDPSAGHFVNFDVLIEDEPRRAWMQERGMPARDGSVTKTDLPGGGVLVELVMDGVGTFTYVMPVATPSGDGGGRVDQWTPGDQGLTYWVNDWQTRGQSVGTGVLIVDPASPYAAWFPGPVVPTQANFGTWDYTNGRIVHPNPYDAGP